MAVLGIDCLLPSGHLIMPPRQTIVEIYYCLLSSSTLQSKHYYIVTDVKHTSQYKQNAHLGPTSYFIVLYDSILSICSIKLMMMMMSHMCEQRC